MLRTEEHMGTAKEVKISVIIPVYKVEPYIRKCLESVLSGTYKNLEVICVNDGSPDNCLQIMQKIAAEDDRLIVVDQNNQGVAAARNNGLSHVTGDYVAFVDSDDFVHPEYFSSMIRCMKKKNADVVICGAQTFMEEDEVMPETFRGASYHRLTAQQFFNSYYARHTVWGKIYRKELLRDKWFTPEVRMADDTLYNLNVISQISNPTIYETNVPLYYYLIRETSIVRTVQNDRMLDTAKWYMLNRGNRLKELTGWEWILPMQVFKLTLSYRYMIMYDQNYKNLKEEANQFLTEVVKDINDNPNVSLKEKAIVNLMFRAPAVYRMWRIVNDPTMLNWEKNQKEIKHSKL